MFYKYEIITLKAPKARDVDFSAFAISHIRLFLNAQYTYCIIHKYV